MCSINRTDVELMSSVLTIAVVGTYHEVSEDCQKAEKLDYKYIFRLDYSGRVYIS